MASKSANITAVSDAGKGYTTVTYSDGSTEKRTGNRNVRNNNPGNLEYNSYTAAMGAVGTDGRFAVFPSPDIGAAAMARVAFNDNYSGLSIRDAIERYAPSFENASAAYAKRVANKIGVPLSTKVGSLNPSQRRSMLSSMMEIEGYPSQQAQKLANEVSLTGPANTQLADADLEKALPTAPPAPDDVTGIRMTPMEQAWSESYAAYGPDPIGIDVDMAGLANKNYQIGEGWNSVAVDPMATALSNDDMGLPSQGLFSLSEPMTANVGPTRSLSPAMREPSIEGFVTNPADNLSRQAQAFGATPAQMDSAYRDLQSGLQEQTRGILAEEPTAVQTRSFSPSQAVTEGTDLGDLAITVPVSNETKNVRTVEGDITGSPLAGVDTTEEPAGEMSSRLDTKGITPTAAPYTPDLEAAITETADLLGPIPAEEVVAEVAPPLDDPITIAPAPQVAGTPAVTQDTSIQAQPSSLGRSTLEGLGAYGISDFDTGTYQGASGLLDNGMRVISRDDGIVSAIDPSGFTRGITGVTNYGNPISNAMQGVGSLFGGLSNIGTPGAGLGRPDPHRDYGGALAGLFDSPQASINQAAATNANYGFDPDGNPIAGSSPNAQSVTQDDDAALQAKLDRLSDEPVSPFGGVVRAVNPRAMALGSLFGGLPGALAARAIAGPAGPNNGLLSRAANAVRGLFDGGVQTATSSYGGDLGFGRVDPSEAGRAATLSGAGSDAFGGDGGIGSGGPSGPGLGGTGAQPGGGFAAGEGFGDAREAGGSVW